MIELRFNPLAHSIIIKVELEYVQKFTARMLLDTGASFTIITPRVAEEIGFNLSKLKTTTLFTASRIENVYQLTLARVSVASKNIDNLEIRCMPLPSELKIDGLLGLNFLRHFNINLNFEKGIITFERITAGSIVLD